MRIDIGFQTEKGVNPEEELEYRYKIMKRDKIQVEDGIDIEEELMYHFKTVDRFNRLQLEKIGHCPINDIMYNGQSLREIIDKHNKWVVTMGKEGRRAVFMRGDIWDANFQGVNLQGAALKYTTFHFADFGKANLRQANMRGSDVTDAYFREADLQEAKLYNVNLSNAYLRRANLKFVKLNEANLYGANLREANLQSADLWGADLREADLQGASLMEADLVGANFENANLTGCRIHGISAWRVKLTGAKQSDLIITKYNEPVITVDNLEVAQFIYLLLHNEKIRYVIDTITSKVVLILGRFTPERKPVLDAIRDELRKCNYLPVLFDFEKPRSQTFIETVSTLAHLARFVIADVTNPKIVIEEISHIVRTIAVPVKPLLLEGSGKEPITLYNLRVNHRSLLNTYCYRDLKNLLKALESEIIPDAEAMVEELQERKEYR